MRTNAREAFRLLQEQAESGALAELCEDNGIVLLVAHGSVTRQEPDTEPRDLDIAFRGRIGANVDLVRLSNELIDAIRFDQIDLMDIARAGPVARARALAPEAFVLHEAESGLFAGEQVRAITEEMETRRLRRLDLELMAA